jgi:peptide/nickel transport system substrate-binding protein
LGIGGHYNDADLITRIAFGTKQRYSTFYNKKFDELRMKAGSTLDDAKAEKAWEEVQVMLKEEAPAIFLYQQFDTYAYNKKLKNWTPRLDEMILLYGASLEK